MKTYYIIDGVNEQFRTLRAAKYHIWIAYTQNERVKYFGHEPRCILKITNEEVVTETPINVTTDGYSFGKTQKL